MIGHLRTSNVIGDEFLERVQSLVQLVGGHRFARFTGSHDPRCRLKSGVPRRLVRALMVVGALAAMGPLRGSDSVEIDIAEAAPLLLVEGHHGALAFEPFGLLADRWPEGRVLVALVVAEDVARRSGPASDLFDLTHLDFAFHTRDYPRYENLIRHASELTWLWIPTRSSRATGLDRNPRSAPRRPIDLPPRIPPNSTVREQLPL